MQKIQILAIRFLNLIANIILMFYIKKFLIYIQIKNCKKIFFQTLRVDNYLLAKLLLYIKI